MRTLSLMVGFLCLFTLGAQSANAKSADAFFKRFQIVRSADGKLVGIRDRTLPVKFQVAPYVSFIKKQLQDEQTLMSKQGLNSGYEAEVRNVLEEGADESFTGDRKSFDQNVDRVVDSLKSLAVLNVDYVFSNEIFKNVVSLYEGKMSEAIMMLDPSMVANVNDSTYFYKRNVTYKAVTWGLDYARKKMSSVPMLNTISYVIVEVEKRITERRQFHQNMLLHYLENFKEEELGLTHEEVNMIWSSVYESRIPWFAFWESKTAKSTWDKYGVNNFYFNYRTATNNLRNAQSIYSEVGERMNFSFQTVTYNNEKVIVNLFDKESMFQNRPAVAYNYDHPTQVVRKRVVLTLAELGLSFVPMSAVIKDTLESFIKSFYQQQKITEGALLGYFESNGDSKGKSQIVAQYLNPFDTLL
jgi:hypothetical protein